MIDLLKRHGIETILFLPPAITSSRFYPAHLANRVPLFDFSDTVRYAALYSTEHHKDGVHLNTAGARVFSRELAALFVERTKLPSATP
jgi:lysophospholipase L1-like esterase